MNNDNNNTDGKKPWIPLKLEILEIKHTYATSEEELWGFSPSGDFWRRELAGS
ncbi:hypothetical protein FHS18_000922 [Paenibacillus phyllosphaerae]|uniref:Uncharacterized protein n=1 Tax=Paenibacillus phyllosphaerae TaxID=274593 RepID=A0A7W5AU88_9BACL|nr:hypothetical protein [Paenibacillus phyllosphaerae]MBB3108870.1 hypothetical protein [Paenibacillus phyllosphaerae]